MADAHRHRRRICFVTGSRAEFGLMRTTLAAVRVHPRLKLQIVATGMHLDWRHGRTLRELAAKGFSPDAIIPWPALPNTRPPVNAANTGAAIAALARTFETLHSDVVLVVGDRVEAFAAAAAAHLSHRLVAHIHGGDRATGQVDDALRHAITKLAHIHFPTTAQSAARIARLGEQAWRIHLVGSPGLDGMRESAAPWNDVRDAFPPLSRRRYALLVVHPADADERLEYARAKVVLGATKSAGFERIIIVYPNNDPGCAGIIRCWDEHAQDAGIAVVRDVPRRLFLGLMRDAAVLAGNSSAGIIEAASFGLPVVDIGPRQAGRERSANVSHCDYDPAAIAQHLRRIWNRGHPLRPRGANVYGRGGAGKRIADALARIELNDRLLRKLIRY